MVSNNGIPIEVKKPFETVYEIKDEYKVPSFEEFMKSYENDGDLNYDDLNGNSVSEIKGCGPCEYSGCPQPSSCRFNLKIDSTNKGIFTNDGGRFSFTTENVKEAKVLARAIRNRDFNETWDEMLEQGPLGPGDEIGIFLGKLTSNITGGAVGLLRNWSLGDKISDKLPELIEIAVRKHENNGQDIYGWLKISESPGLLGTGLGADLDWSWSY